MGRDKALLEVDGRPLALIAADALRGAGADDVFVVGGDEHARRGLGLPYVADRWPGEGPLGGIITALDSADRDPVAVLSCDLPNITADAVTQLYGSLDTATDAVVARAEGRDHPLIAIYRKRCEPPLHDAFATGQRAVRAALTPLCVVYAELRIAEWARNVNVPPDMA
jgi:molybdenum cofactor guanylyltransferase